MILIGQIDYCGKIIFDNELDERLIEKEELLLRILPILLSSSYFENTLILINNALNNTKNEIILFPSIATLLLKSETKNKKKLKLIESFFLAQLKKALNLNLDSLIATSYYNLGNFYKNHGENHKAISHYVRAKKNDSNYLKRSYYYQEIAGICFEEKKFVFSAKFYQKAISLGASNKTKIFLGDALMFSGEYKKAVEIFEEYLFNNNTEHNEEFLLKFILLQNIIEDRKIYSQKRQSNEADNIVGNIPNLINLEKALDKDLLCSLAWFNLGIMNSGSQNFEEATIYFALSGSINVWDIEAWTLSFLTFLNSKKKEHFMIITLVLLTAYKYNEDRFLQYLYERLEEGNQASKDIIEMIENILVNNIDREINPVLRIIGVNSEIEEIEIKK